MEFIDAKEAMAATCENPAFKETLEKLSYRIKEAACCGMMCLDIQLKYPESYKYLPVTVTYDMFFGHIHSYLLSKSYMVKVSEGSDYEHRRFTIQWYW